MVRSMRVTVEPGAHIEPVEYIQMITAKVLTLQMKKTLTFIFGFVRLDSQNKNLDANLWYMLPMMILCTAIAQL